MRYFKEMAGSNLNPSELKFSKELFSNDTNYNRIYRVKYFNGKIAQIVNRSNFVKLEANYQFDPLNNYKSGVINDDGNHFECSYTYNSTGLLIENKVSKNGEISIWRNKYDEKGRKLEEGYYDNQNHLIADNNGIAIYRYKYDEKGNKLEERYYDNEDHLMGDFRGIAIYRYKYDEKGNKIEEGYYDKENQLISGDIAIYRYQYNDKGNIIEQTTYDNQDKLVANSVGVIRLRYKYNEKDKKIEEISINDDNSWISNKFIYLEDDIQGERELWVEQGYYNSMNQLTNNEYGWSTFRLKYDEKGNNIEEGYYDNQNHLVEVNRIALHRYKYDDYGKKLEEANYNKNGDLAEDISGVAITRFLKGDLGNDIKEYHFNKKEKLVNEGIAIIHYTENDLPHYFNKKGKEIFYNEQKDKYE